MKLQQIKNSNLTEPANQAAKAALKQLKEPVEFWTLHCIQLMQWATNNQVALTTDTLELALYRFQEISPQTFLKEMDFPRTKNLPKEPKELALTLIQDLETWIQDKVPSYQEVVNQRLKDEMPDLVIKK